MPVRYMSLAEIGIDPSALDFLPIDHAGPCSENDAAEPATGDEVRSEVLPLSLVEAKQGLAAYYRVSLEAVEIIIRG